MIIQLEENHLLIHSLCFYCQFIFYCYQHYMTHIPLLLIQYQGDEKLDTDIPTNLEARLFCTTFGKMVWMFFQPLFYALRPIITYPKNPTSLEIINTTVQLTFNFCLFYFLGGEWKEDRIKFIYHAVWVWVCVCVCVHMDVCVCACALYMSVFNILQKQFKFHFCTIKISVSHKSDTKLGKNSIIYWHKEWRIE